MPTIESITGHFVLCTEDGEFTFNEKNEIMYNSDGSPVISNPVSLFYESSAGENKAKYWTKEIEDAYIFNNIDDAMDVAIATHKENSKVRIRRLKVRGQEEQYLV